MLYIFYYVTHYTHTRMLSGLLSVDGWCEIVCVDLDCWRCCRISVILSSVISIFWSDFEFIFDSHHFCIPWIFLGFCPDLIFDFLWISVLLPLPLWEVIRLLLWISVRPIYRSYFGNFSFSEHINHLVKAILVDLFVQVGAVPKTRNPRREIYDEISTECSYSRYDTTEYWSSYIPLNLFVTRKDPRHR